MTIVALTGYDGGELAGLLGQQDVKFASLRTAARASRRCTCSRLTACAI
jgi:phosphoheptose isomerase